MTDNIITAVFGAMRETKVRPRYRYDQGQVLVIRGVRNLPDFFEAHFANEGSSSDATIVIGTPEGVEIPNSFFETGTTILCYIYVHNEATDGTTVYKVVIPVINRARPADVEPTPEEADVIAQAIVALNENVGRAEDAADGAAQSERNASAHADRAETAAAAAETAEGNVEGYVTRAETAAQNASEAAQNAASDASDAADSASDAEQAKNDAASSAIAAAASASESAESATQAQFSRERASQYATAAGNQASSARTQADIASFHANNAMNYAARAGISATNAATSESNAAVSATAAATSETNAAGSASAAAQSATDAAASAAAAAQTLTQVQAEGAAQIAAIDAEGQEVLGSIPADYTALSADVTDLKSQIHYEEIPSKNLNITPYPASATVKGVTFTANADGTISISGAPTDDIWWPDISNADLRWLLPAGTYTLSGAIGATKALQLYLYASKTDSTSAANYSCGPNNARPVTFTTEQDFWAVLRVAISRTASITGTEILYPQVESGDTKTDYASPWAVTKQSAIDTINSELDAIDARGDVLEDRIAVIDGAVNPSYEYGNIQITGSGWTYSASSTRIRTQQNTTVALKKYDIIVIDDGIQIYVGAKKSDDSYYNGNTWKTGTYTCAVDGDYVIVARYADEAAITNISDVASKIHITRMDSMAGDVMRMSQNLGTGNTEYIGEQIIIEPLNRYLCNVDIWNTYDADNIPSGASAISVLRRHQSMTIFGGYMFLFSEYGGGAVIDMDTKEMISTFTTEPTSYQHQNSAQFSDVYYDDADEFPLVFVSRCGNSAYQSGEHQLDEMLIYRVQRSGTAFTFTLINAVYNAVQTYGMSWSVDNVTHKLYCAAPIVSNWQQPTGNKIGFWVFQEPSKSDILSGTNITLSDAVAYFETNYVTIQGCCVNGGKLYQGITVSPSHEMWVYDLFAGKILSKLPIVIGWEVEGIAIDGGKIYASAKSGDVVRIYEVTL